MVKFDERPPPLQVSLLREQTSDLLREVIASGRLAPGDRLVVRELVEWAGVSRATIREALQQLAAEGLVTTIPHKGMVVAAPSLKEVSEFYEIRAMLEGLVGRQFAERATEAEIAELRQRVEDLRKATLDESDTKAMVRAKDRFYELLVNGADNSAVETVLGSLRTRITVFRMTSMAQPGRPARMMEEIERIVAAIEAGDSVAAEQACREHVMAAAGVVIEALSAPGPVLENANGAGAPS